MSKPRVAALSPAVYSNPRRRAAGPRRRFSLTLSAPVAAALEATRSLVLRRAGLRFSPQQLFRYAALSGITVVPEALCSDGIIALEKMQRVRPTVRGLLAQAEALAWGPSPKKCTRTR